jgi:hypothetical protein
MRFKYMSIGFNALTTITGVLKGDKLMENKAAKFSDLSAA